MDAVGHGRVLKGYSSNSISFELPGLKSREVLGTRKLRGLPTLQRRQAIFNENEYYEATEGILYDGGIAE